MVGCTHCLLLFNFPSFPQRCDVHPHLSTETVLAKVITDDLITRSNDYFSNVLLMELYVAFDIVDHCLHETP